MEIKNNTPNINFNAKLIAKAVTHVGKKEIKLYNLDASDKDFAKEMVSKVDLGALYPNLDDYSGFAAWKHIIKTSVDKVGVDNVVLATHNKRPCGILVYKKNSHKTFHLTNLATWPIKENIKAPHAGKVLMHSIFAQAKRDKIDSIYLLPSQFKPLGKSCLDFYQPLGFKSKDVGLMPYVALENVDYSVKTAQLENFFDVKFLENSKNVDLNKELSLEFKDTFTEKIVGLFNKLKNKSLSK